MLIIALTEQVPCRHCAKLLSPEADRHCPSPRMRMRRRRLCQTAPRRPTQVVGHLARARLLRSLLGINSWNCWSTVFGAPVVGAGGLYEMPPHFLRLGGSPRPFRCGLPDPHFTPSRPTPRCSPGPCPGPPSACWPRLLPWPGARARWLPGTDWPTDQLTDRGTDSA